MAYSANDKCTICNILLIPTRAPFHVFLVCDSCAKDKNNVHWADSNMELNRIIGRDCDRIWCIPDCSACSFSLIQARNKSDRKYSNSSDIHFDIYRP